MLWLFIWMFYQKQRGLADCIHCLGPKNPKRKQQNFRSFPKNTKSFIFQTAFHISIKVVRIFQRPWVFSEKRGIGQRVWPHFDVWLPIAFKPLPHPCPFCSVAGPADKKVQVGSSNHTSSGTHVEIFTSSYLLIRVKAKLVSIPSSPKPVLELFGARPGLPRKPQYVSHKTYQSPSVLVCSPLSWHPKQMLGVSHRASTVTTREGDLALCGFHETNRNNSFAKWFSLKILCHLTKPADRCVPGGKAGE